MKLAAPLRFTSKSNGLEPETSKWQCLTPATSSQDGSLNNSSSGLLWEVSCRNLDGTENDVTDVAAVDGPAKGDERREP